MVRKMQKKRP